MRRRCLKLLDSFRLRKALIAANQGGTPDGALLSLLILPLFVPVLIFGVSAVEAALTGIPTQAPLLILAALALAALALAPWPAAAALRQAVE